MIVWTPAVLIVLYACVLYFCIGTSSAQLSMFYMERHSRNTLIITIITITQSSTSLDLNLGRSIIPKEQSYETTHTETHYTVQYIENHKSVMRGDAWCNG